MMLISPTKGRRDQLWREDRGAYAILFAIIVVVLVGMVALVVDLALVRENRARSRSAVDAAVTASAGLLNGGNADGNPRAACETAWEYLRQSVGGLPDGSAQCDDLPALVGTCTETESRADWSGDEFRVVVTWPVPQTSLLMSNPDTAPAYPSQGYNEDVDGPDACSRVGVEVYRTSSTFFASILGVDETTTRSASVARSISVPGNGQVVAALNILDKTGCQVLTSDGGATVTVGRKDVDIAPDDPRPGIIGVDSDGSDCGNGNFDKVIAPSGATGTGIWAFGTGATIQSYAVAVRPDKAFAPGFVGVSEDSPSTLWPAPSTLSQPVGRLPVDLYFNCTSGMECQEGGGDYINDLKASYSTLTREDVDLVNATSPGFWTIVDGDWCDSPPGDNSFPGANIFIDCEDGIEVTTTLVFPAATAVVATGGISAQNGGCLVLNSVDTGSTSTACPATFAEVDDTPVTKEAIVFIQSGHLLKQNGGSVFMRNTFSYLGDGFADFQSGSSASSGYLYLTSPQCDVPISGSGCDYSNFDKLTLWSEKEDASGGTPREFKFTGGAYQKLRGVLFTPNGTSVLVGVTGTDQIRAQFWTNELRVTGQGAVNMDVDEADAIPRPAYGAALIR